MVTVEATCPNCGSVEFSLDGIELFVFTICSFYMFKCPSCQEYVTKQADDKVIGILTSEGLRPKYVDGPSEVNDPDRLIEDPLTYDVVLDTIIDLNLPDAAWLLSHGVI